MGDRSDSASGIGGLMDRDEDGTVYETGYEMTGCCRMPRNHAARRSHFLFNV